jgi:hypothetical protein
MRKVVPALLYRKNVYSQGGEDGILEELLRRLPSTTNWVCEFGAMDGVFCSNTFRRVKNHGAHAIYIEADAQFFSTLQRTAQAVPTITPIHARVEVEGDSTLDAILARTPIPIEFDILSIDIDSYDYQVWKSVRVYRPKIVVVEINSGLSPTDPTLIHGEGSPQGTGFLPMLLLGREKGYTLVCHTGNLIFIRNDLRSVVSDLLIREEDCYLSDWIFN